MTYEYKFLKQLPKQVQADIGSAVDSIMESKKEQRLEAVRKIAKQSTVDTAEKGRLVNEVIATGDVTDYESRILADEIAKKIHLGEELEDIAKAPTYLVNAGGTAGNNAGLMNQAYGNRFYEEVVKESSFFQEVDMFQMAARTQKIDRFRRGSRLLYPGMFDPSANTAFHGGRALKPAQYYGYTTGLTEFAATPYTGVLSIPAEDVKDNIMGGNLIPFLLSQAVDKQLAYDWSDLLINGDTAITDAAAIANPALKLLQSKDGLLKLAGTTVDFATGGFNAARATTIKKAVPVPNRRHMKNAKFWLPDNASLDYIKSKTDVVTDQGFLMGINDFPNPKLLGTEMKSLDEMPAANALYLDPKMNVKFGIWDAMSIVSEYKPETDEYVFYMRTRIDFKVMEPLEIIKVTNLG